MDVNKPSNYGHMLVHEVNWSISNMLNMTWYWHFRMTWMCDMIVLDVAGSLVSIPTTKTQSNGMGTQKWAPKNGHCKWCTLILLSNLDPPGLKKNDPWHRRSKSLRLIPLVKIPWVPLVSSSTLWWSVPPGPPSSFLSNRPGPQFPLSRRHFPPVHRCRGFARLQASHHPGVERKKTIQESKMTTQLPEGNRSW